MTTKTGQITREAQQPRWVSLTGKEYLGEQRLGLLQYPVPRVGKEQAGQR